MYCYRQIQVYNLRDYPNRFQVLGGAAFSNILLIRIVVLAPASAPEISNKNKVYSS
jgi:hypothetical protein